MQSISENTQLLQDKNYEEILNNLLKIKLSLIEIFGENTNKYSEIMNSILLNQYKSDRNYINREKYMEILLSDKDININDKLIEKSYPLIQEIFKFEALEPSINKEKDNNNINLENEKLKKKFLSIFQNTNQVKEFINKANNIKLNKIILYHFEIICDNYFKKLQNNKNKNICCGLSKIYLEESVN